VDLGKLASSQLLVFKYFPLIHVVASLIHARDSDSSGSPRLSPPIVAFRSAKVALMGRSIAHVPAQFFSHARTFTERKDDLRFA
jgi:hypothetical protein